MLAVEPATADGANRLGCNGFNGHNGCWTAKRGETAPVLMEAVSVDDIFTSDGFFACGFEYAIREPFTREGYVRYMIQAVC